MSEQILTEQSNPASTDIDLLSGRQIVELINREDQKVAIAVAAETENIGRAVELIAAAFQKGGRLGYFGAGTSGRIGILDASECPPTFGTAPELVQAFIAGRQPSRPASSRKRRRQRRFCPAGYCRLFSDSRGHCRRHFCQRQRMLYQCRSGTGPSPGSANHRRCHQSPRRFPAICRYFHLPRSRPGSDCRIVPAEIWHRPENDIKHAHHRRHDSLRKNLQKLYD